MYSQKQIETNETQGIDTAVVAKRVREMIEGQKVKPNTILMKQKFIFQLMLALPKRMQDKIVRKMKG